MLLRVRRCPALVPVTAVTKNSHLRHDVFLHLVTHSLFNACYGQLLSRGVFVEYLGDRLDMFLEGLLLFGVMAGEELSTILSSLIEPAFESGDMLPLTLLWRQVPGVKS